MIPADAQTLWASGRLGCLYNDEGIEVGVGDQIIAATAILQNSIIFTCNGRDFPPPFFKELDRKLLTYERLAIWFVGLFTS